MNVKVFNLKMIFQEPKTPQDRTPRPNNLQFQRTTILSGSDCWTTFKDMIGSDNHSDWPALKKDIDQTIICTTNIVGTGMCGGDSGSGIVVNNTLVGIVSSTLGKLNCLTTKQFNHFRFPKSINYNYNYQIAKYL